MIRHDIECVLFIDTDEGINTSLVSFEETDQKCTSSHCLFWYRFGERLTLSSVFLCFRVVISFEESLNNGELCPCETGT